MTEQPISFHDADLEAPRTTERRAWVRFPKNDAIWCEPVRPLAKRELDTAWMGRLRNISRNGIGLSLKKRFEPGTPLLIELSESPRVSRHLAAHVVHATPDKNGRWIIGCRFDCPLSLEEMQIFVQEEHAKQ
jgi:PilZ domain